MESCAPIWNGTPWPCSSFVGNRFGRQASDPRSGGLATVTGLRPLALPLVAALLAACTGVRVPTVDETGSDVATLVEGLQRRDLEIQVLPDSENPIPRMPAARVLCVEQMKVYVWEYPDVHSTRPWPVDLSGAEDRRDLAGHGCGDRVGSEEGGRWRQGGSGTGSREPEQGVLRRTGDGPSRAGSRRGTCRRGVEE